MIRDIKAIDEDFIYDSWIKSVKCPTRAVSSMTRFVIDNAYNNRNIKVFCADDDENHILGWAAHGSIETTPLLHFVFVKKAFRNNGIGKKLLRDIYPDEKSTVFCTYWSHNMQLINARDKWNVRFIANLLPAYIYSLLSNDHSKNEVESYHG